MGAEANFEDHYSLVSTSAVTVGDQEFDGLQVARDGKSTTWFMIGSQSSNPSSATRAKRSSTPMAWAWCKAARAN
jgi:hypothetical protein